MKNNKIILVIIILVILLILIIVLNYNFSLEKQENVRVIGGERDEYGCLGPAGYSWNESIGACIREWELDESQKKAVQIVVAPLSYYVTITIVNKLPCDGCFDVYYVKNDISDSSILVGIKGWNVTSE
jgi:hypothetical protein